MSELSPRFSLSAHAAGILLVVAMLASALSATPAIAQTVDSIQARPGAVSLRSIWSMRGNGAGSAVSALWDITGDRRMEFGVKEFDVHRWTIFGIDSTHVIRPLWQHPSSSPYPLVHGDFRGDDRRMLVQVREVDTAILGTLFYLDFFAVDSGRIADTPSMTWTSRSPGIRMIAKDFLVEDLDRDGAEELIISAATTVRDGIVSTNGEIWIYRGGVDFRIDTPTVVIRDARANNSDYELHIGRVDADEYPDLVCATGVDTRIRWGGSDLLALDRPVDRSLGTINRFLDLLDADGDGQSDMLWYGAFLALSSSGKDPHTRSFDGNDVERHFVGRGAKTIIIGPLNDSAERYEMFGLNSALGDNVELIFSGSVNGPDRFYDATYSARADGVGSGSVTIATTPAGDIDGNGWRDFIGGNEYDAVAVVIGGGPHIPRDSMPASAIRDIAIGSHRDAITVWPNPADDIVHIAWRGDLSRTPARFAVHDLLGRLVARGEADAQRGEVLWNCGQRPAGAYLLSVFDRHGCIITTTTIMKR